MHIDTTCACGKSLRVGKDLAGRKIRCPQCKKVYAVPSGPRTNRLEDQASAILLSGPAQSSSSRRPKSDPALSHTPPPPSRNGFPKLTLDGSSPNHTAFATHTNFSEEDETLVSIHPRTLGGILLAAIGICWLGSGYAPGWFLIFPAILLGFGFVSAVKGVFPGD